MIDLHWLNVFRTVYECRSFSRAGEMLALSQPTVSAHVASLEKATGAKLFERLGRRVLPTQAGEHLYYRSTDIFSHLESLEGGLRGAGELSAGCLRVFASTVPGHCLVPAYLASFFKKYPRITAQVRISDSATVNTAVSDGLCSFGFTGAAIESETLIYEKIFDDELILVGAPCLLQAEKDERHVWQHKISLQELIALPWIMRPVGSATRTIFLQALAARGYQPDLLKIRAEGSDSQSVLALVRQGLGITVMSRLTVRPLLECGSVQEISVVDLSMRRPIYIMRNRYRKFFSVESLFWEFVVTEGYGCISGFTSDSDEK